ncbi:hypothetical protein SSX86_002457 [Deinandra increscens subsp. villosa]|uniref:F-box/LRR-repeat protein 15/At3g58940/PEG3-like LRR domain-containing protein n=1 Tax=Deinandra increscens subsp. villosa TaxID=3103831 RepID=A0AAP0DNN3_9ASTR
MEAKCLSEAQQLSLDIITTLPETITETILCLLPIEEAARTSILSREWRYKWTKIPKLIFHSSGEFERTGENTASDIQMARKNMDGRCKLFYVVYQVLLLHQGPIHEFALHMDADYHCFEVDQIILYLSRNHALKKLQLEFMGQGVYKLPLCAFSLHQLTDLDLSQIDLDHQPIFGGFPKLRSLNLCSVSISTKALLHLLSNCPSLTRFIVFFEGTDDKDCTIIELFECLPAIEHLDTHTVSFVEMLVLDSLPKELPTLLIHLRYVRLKDAWLSDDGLCFLAALIKCSPNLEKICLELDCIYDYDDEIWSGILEEYSDVSLEHLNELEIGYFSIMNPEMEFVKFILARSPKLKKLRLWGLDETDQLDSEMLKTLLRSQCVSPVEIVVE